MTRDRHQHWQDVYRSKSPEQTSWFTPHLRTSLDLVLRSAPDRNSPILDAGGGESTLVDDLLDAGYQDVTVLDISGEALLHAQRRLGDAACRVQWRSDDILTAAIPSSHYAVWHDRAVFHFLTEPEQRAAYVRQATHAVHSGGTLILATFALSGPETCSGLPVQRHDAASIGRAFAPHFTLLESFEQPHTTPFGKLQPFTWCRLRRVNGDGEI